MFKYIIMNNLPVLNTKKKLMCFKPKIVRYFSYDLNNKSSNNYTVYRVKESSSFLYKHSVTFFIKIHDDDFRVTLLKGVDSFNNKQGFCDYDIKNNFRIYKYWRSVYTLLSTKKRTPFNFIILVLILTTCSIFLVLAHVIVFFYTVVFFLLNIFFVILLCVISIVSYKHPFIWEKTRWLFLLYQEFVLIVFLNKFNNILKRFYDYYVLLINPVNPQACCDFVDNFNLKNAAHLDIFFLRMFICVSIFLLILTNNILLSVLFLLPFNIFCYYFTFLIAKYLVVNNGSLDRFRSRVVIFSMIMTATSILSSFLIYFCLPLIIPPINTVVCLLICLFENFSILLYNIENSYLFKREVLDFSVPLINLIESLYNYDYLYFRYIDCDINNEFGLTRYQMLQDLHLYLDSLKNSGMLPETINNSFTDKISFDKTSTLLKEYYPYFDDNGNYCINNPVKPIRCSLTIPQKLSAFIRYCLHLLFK